MHTGPDRAWLSCALLFPVSPKQLIHHALIAINVCHLLLLYKHSNFVMCWCFLFFRHQMESRQFCEEQPSVCIGRSFIKYLRSAVVVPGLERPGCPVVQFVYSCNCYYWHLHSFGTTFSLRLPNLIVLLVSLLSLGVKKNRKQVNGWFPAVTIWSKRIVQ